MTTEEEREKVEGRLENHVTEVEDEGVCCRMLVDLKLTMVPTNLCPKTHHMVVGIFASCAPVFETDLCLS